MEYFYPAHIIHGEEVIEDITLHLSPTQWIFAVIDLVDDPEEISCSSVTTDSITQHINQCVDNIINLVENSHCILECLRSRGVWRGYKQYKMNARLLDFFDNLGIHVMQTHPDKFDWGLRGIIWTGIHSEICVSQSITNMRNIFPHLHNYVIGNCTHHLLEINQTFLSHFVCNNWNNTTMIHSDHATFRKITYDTN